MFARPRPTPISVCRGIALTIRHSAGTRRVFCNVLRCSAENMEFSFRRTMLFAPVHFTELVIYGKKGIDIKSRLLLYDALRGNRLTDQQLRDALLRVLPLDFGERFTVAASVLMLVLGVLFIWLANEPVREFVLQIHRISDGPLD